MDSIHNMELPLIVDNRGDTLIFRSAAGLEDYLEAQDVLDNQFIAYDSQGCLLTLSVNSRGAVVVSVGVENPTHADTLKQLLIKYLTFYQEPQDGLDAMPLDELVTKSLEQEYWSHPEATWIDFLLPILTWLLIIAASVGSGYAVHQHEPHWPQVIDWLVGVFVFIVGSFLSGGVNLIIKSFLGIFRKKSVGKDELEP